LKRRLASLVAGLGLSLLLAGCTQLQKVSTPSAASKLRLHAAPAAFVLDGRISVKAGEESFSGGMQWRRNVSQETLLLRTPLGQGVAELRRTAAGMELKNAEGRIFVAADADALARQALGVEMPVRGLTWWVVGLPQPNTPYQAIADKDGHLGELRQDGWHILFSRYAEHGGQPLPGRLVARRGDDLEVRLVADAWELP
jgi:outer membrane lipoprotein LolB